MFPDPADSDSSRPDKRWSRKKTALIFGGAFLGSLALVLFYDTRLEPCDDLLPLSGPAVPAGENGYVWMRGRWETLAGLKHGERSALRAMLQGTKPWNETLISIVRRGRENLVADLETALALPEWIPAPTGDTWTWPANVSLLLKMETALALKSGDRVQTLKLLETHHRLALAQISGSRHLVPFYVGNVLLRNSADSYGDFLAKGPLEPAEWERVEKTWQPEPVTAEGLIRLMNTEAAVFREAVLSSETDYGFRVKYPGLARLFVKKNQTLNRYHFILRRLEREVLVTAPSRSDVVFYGLNAPGEPGSDFRTWTNPNFIGERMLQNQIAVLAMLKEREAPVMLFVIRAMRVRLAIQRWQAEHGGAVPGRLEDVGMAAIPLDPWNGKPLLWKAKPEIIYAVGHDWDPDVPAFPASSSGDWVLGDSESPGLRLKMPPPPPPPPPRPKGKPILKPTVPAVPAVPVIPAAAPPVPAAAPVIPAAGPPGMAAPAVAPPAPAALPKGPE